MVYSVLSYGYLPGLLIVYLPFNIFKFGLNFYVQQSAIWCSSSTFLGFAGSIYARFSLMAFISLNSIVSSTYFTIYLIMDHNSECKLVGETMDWLKRGTVDLEQGDCSINFKCEIQSNIMG